MNEASDPYRYFGSFSAMAGTRILQAFEKALIRFEVGFDESPDGRVPLAKFYADWTAYTRAVKLYVHDEDRARAAALMAELGHRPQDFAAETAGS